MELIISNFIVLFSVVDPIGVAWLFGALTHGESIKAKRRMALTATLFAGVILLVFFFSGTALLDWFGITIPAFRIAGGALLFLLSIDMVFARQSGLRSTTSDEQVEAERKQDITVFPLAFPLLAGPGALTTVLLMTSSSADATVFWQMFAVVIVVLVLTFIALYLAPFFVEKLGETGANVISRVLGLILTAMAVQYVIDGIKISFGL